MERAYQVRTEIAGHNVLRSAPPASARSTSRRLKCSLSQVDRLLDISHHSKLDQLDAAFAVISKRLAIEIWDSA
jgi:hypothetical protein